MRGDDVAAEYILRGIGQRPPLGGEDDVALCGWSDEGSTNWKTHLLSVIVDASVDNRAVVL